MTAGEIRKIIDQWYSAHQCQDIGFFDRLLADDIEWTMNGPPQAFPVPNSLYGKRAVLDAIAQVHEALYVVRNVQREVMIGTYVLSAGYYDAYYIRAQKVRTLIKRDFEQCFAAGIDAMLTPATPSAAFGIGEKGGADPVEMYLNDIFTVTVNMAGLPGIAVPAGKDVQGLPLGLQLIGKPFDEETLFALGQKIEDAAGHFAAPRWW